VPEGSSLIGPDGKMIELSSETISDKRRMLQQIDLLNREQEQNDAEIKALAERKQSIGKIQALLKQQMAEETVGLEQGSEPASLSSVESRQLQRQEFEAQAFIPADEEARMRVSLQQAQELRAQR